MSFPFIARDAKPLKFSCHPAQNHITTLLDHPVNLGTELLRP
jgi:hypothetical protein